MMVYEDSVKMGKASSTGNGHPSELKNWRSVNPKCLKTILLFVVIVCLAYLFLEIPFMEVFQETRFKNILSEKPAENSQRQTGDSNEVLGLGNIQFSPESTTMEIETLEGMIKRFNKKAVNLPQGLFEKYTGDHDVASFLEWTMGKIMDLSSQIKESYKQEPDKESVTTKKKPGQKGKKTTKVSEFDTNTQRKTKVTNERPGDAIAAVTTENKAKSKERVAKKNGLPRTRLVLFTTWIDKPEKKEAHDNVLRTWRLWEPLVIPLVFTNDSNIATRAQSFGWQVLPEPLGGCQGRKVPLLREMFRKAMANYDSQLYAFVNGDLLLGNGMLSTVEALVNNKILMEKPLLGLINRINVDFYNIKREPVYTLKAFDSLAGDGKPMADGSSDGYVTNKLFPWQHVPDIVPGRKGIAMWLVSYAREMGAATVDVSETLRAVHMMATQAGNRESSYHPGGQCNHKIFNKLKIKPRSWFCGFLKCAQYKTTREETEGSKVSIVDKSDLNHPRCGECEMDVELLKSTVY